MHGDPRASLETQAPFAQKPAGEQSTLEAQVVGQVGLSPSQRWKPQASAGVGCWYFGASAHTPSWTELQLPHGPHAESQQIPVTQEPLAQLDPEVHIAAS